MSLTDNAGHAVERKLVEETLHGDVAESKYLKVLWFPVGVAVLIWVNGLNYQMVYWKSLFLVVFRYEKFEGVNRVFEPIFEHFRRPVVPPRLLLVYYMNQNL